MKDQYRTSGKAAPYRIEYEKMLNPAQLKAVMFQEGSLLVIAGAGSGKTRTLTYRVARLVEDGIAPDSILLLTFTRKASAEMLYRASRLLDSRCQKVAGGTFHSFANSVLRRYCGLFGFENGFSIMDRSDSEALIGIVKKEIGVTHRQRGFPRNHTLANVFSKAANKALTVEDIVYSDYAHFIPFMEDIAGIQQGYTLHKVRHQFFDYDDLLLYLRILLRDHPQVRERLSARYRYVLVDEYQDTNLIQADILYLLVGGNRNVMAVGDDSQSIYAFRGANFRNIMEFPNLFPGTTIIGLEENYRSVQPILNLTNAVIEQAAEKYEKKLFTRKAGGAKPLLVDTGSENRQSNYIVSRIQQLSREAVALKDIAVLFRAGFHSFDLEIELAREQIPFIKVGGFKFMESAHIKDVLAHMRVLSNPNDRVSWYRLLSLMDKVGPKTAQNIFEAVQREGRGAAGVAAVKERFRKIEGLSKLAELYSRIGDETPSVEEMGEVVLNYYHPILRERYDDHPKRLKDLEQLLEIMARYGNLGEFLVDMALEPPSAAIGGVLSEDAGEEDRLVLSTIHSAKGLEWHTVFIIWAVDGRFPSIHSLDDRDNLEEELRLMYVAATRAREELIITYPSQVFDRGSGLVSARPSRFVDMLAEDVMERTVVDYW